MLDMFSSLFRAITQIFTATENFASGLNAGAQVFKDEMEGMRDKRSAERQKELQQLLGN